MTTTPASKDYTKLYVFIGLVAFILIVYAFLRFIGLKYIASWWITIWFIIIIIFFNIAIFFINLFKKPYESNVDYIPINYFFVKADNLVNKITPTN